MAFGIDDVIGSVIGAGASIIGGSQNAAAIRDTNRTNKEIAESNNAYNEKMWNLNNAYNDPSAQVARDIKAGINPFLNGANVGNVESKSVQGTMPAPMQSPQPGNGLMAAAPALSNFSTMMLNQQLLKSQVVKSDADAKTSQAEALLAETKAKKLSGVDTDKTHMEIENLGYEGRLKSLQSDAQEIQNRVNDVFANPIAKANLAKIQADVASTLASKNLTDAQIKTEVQKAIMTSAEANKIKLESKQIDTLLPYLVTQYKLTNTGQSNANQLSTNEVNFQNSHTVPTTPTFGEREKAARVANAENTVQIGGVNIDKSKAEQYKIDQESKLLVKDNAFYFISKLGQLIPLSFLIK